MQSSKPSLLELVELFKYRACSDPRDRVFAVLSLAADGEAAKNEPDCSLSLAEVQRRLVQSSIRRLKVLDVLSCASGIPIYPAKFQASWAPEWGKEDGNPWSLNRKRFCFGFTQKISQTLHFRSFCASSKSVPKASAFGSNLIIRGFSFDKIRFIFTRPFPKHYDCGIVFWDQVGARRSALSQWETTLLKLNSMRGNPPPPYSASYRHLHDSF
jgi:hypothetical protein